MGQILYYNGTIITMEERNAPYAEAVLTEGERIKARGSFDAVKAQASKEAHLADLQGRTMIPGFIDPHSHFTAFPMTTPVTKSAIIRPGSNAYASFSSHGMLSSKAA